MYAKFYVAEAQINLYGVRLLCNMKLFHQAKQKEVWFLLGLPRVIVLFLQGFPVINSFFVQSWLLLIKLSIYGHFF